MSIGLKSVPQKTGYPISVSADGAPKWMDIGVTLAWSLVTPAANKVTLDDGTVIFAGERYMRYGQVLVPITAAGAAEQQTVDLSGDDDPTGGTWPLTILGKTLEDLAWNISAADLQTAIRAAADDPDDALARVEVSKTGFVYTLTFPADAGNVDPVTSSAADLTGGVGDTFAVTINTTTPGINYHGEYAPFDSSKSDGRQTLARDNVGILNQTIKEAELTVLGGNLQNDIHGLIIGGRVRVARIMVGGTNQPTWSALQAVMPELIAAKSTAPI